MRNGDNTSVFSGSLPSTVHNEFVELAIINLNNKVVRVGGVSVARIRKHRTDASSEQSFTVIDVALTEFFAKGCGQTGS